MAQEPTLTDYVSTIMQLFKQFMQHRISKESIHKTNFSPSGAHLYRHFSCYSLKLYWFL